MPDINVGPAGCLGVSTKENSKSQRQKFVTTQLLSLWLTDLMDKSTTAIHRLDFVFHFRGNILNNNYWFNFPIHYPTEGTTREIIWIHRAMRLGPEGSDEQNSDWMYVGPVHADVLSTVGTARSGVTVSHLVNLRSELPWGGWVQNVDEGDVLRIMHCWAT